MLPLLGGADGSSTWLQGQFHRHVNPVGLIAYVRPHNEIPTGTVDGSTFQSRSILGVPAAISASGTDESN